MESTGEGSQSQQLLVSFCQREFLLFFLACKIHITSEVNDQLQLIGGFRTEPRGLIDVKVILRRQYFLNKTPKILEFHFCRAKG